LPHATKKAKTVGRRENGGNMRIEKQKPEEGCKATHCPLLTKDGECASTKSIKLRGVLLQQCAYFGKNCTDKLYRQIKDARDKGEVYDHFC